MIVILQNLREIISRFVYNTIPWIASLQKKRTWYYDLFFKVITAIAGVGIYAVVIPTIVLFYP